MNVFIVSMGKEEDRTHIWTFCERRTDWRGMCGFWFTVKEVLQDRISTSNGLHESNIDWWGMSHSKNSRCNSETGRGIYKWLTGSLTVQDWPVSKFVSDLSMRYGSDYPSGTSCCDHTQTGGPRKSANPFLVYKLMCLGLILPPILLSTHVTTS